MLVLVQRVHKAGLRYGLVQLLQYSSTSVEQTQVSDSELSGYSLQELPMLDLETMHSDLSQQDTITLHLVIVPSMAIQLGISILHEGLRHSMEMLDETGILLSELKPHGQISDDHTMQLLEDKHSTQIAPTVTMLPQDISHSVLLLPMTMLPLDQTLVQILQQGQVIFLSGTMCSQISEIQHPISSISETGFMETMEILVSVQ